MHGSDRGVEVAFRRWRRQVAKGLMVDGWDLVCRQDMTVYQGVGAE